jgi:hypothetical protein
MFGSSRGVVLALGLSLVPSIGFAQQVPGTADQPVYPPPSPVPHAQQPHAQQPYAQQPYAQQPYAGYAGYPAPVTTPYAATYATQPPPADTVDRGSDGTGPLIGGFITLGSFYLASVLTGAGLGEACAVQAPEQLEGTDIEITICGDANTDVAYIPVAGPFIAMAELQDTEVSVWPLNVALAGVGLGQVTGLGLLLAGAFMSGDDAPAAAPPVVVTPMVGPTTAALTMRATF